MSNTQYSEKIKTAQPKVIKAYKDAIASVKEVIAKKSKLYTGDPKNYDFDALNALGGEMENAIKKATLAMNLRAQAKLLGDLDTSIVKVGKARELGERLKSSETSEAQEQVMKEISESLTSA
jgi:hypothetical protein|tara:strand:+ start:1757 stop:2122 length:366 start_codon:yes stop_codon:yes gene_type:complete